MNPYDTLYQRLLNVTFFSGEAIYNIYCGHCSSHTLKPLMLQALGCSGSLLREIVQHWSQEGSELGCIFVRPRVLFRHDIAETPKSVSRARSRNFMGGLEE